MLKWLACDSLKFTNVVELFHHNKHSIESMSDRSFALLKSRILKSHGPKVNKILIIAPTVNRADKPNLNKPSVLNTCTRFSVSSRPPISFCIFPPIPNLLSVCATPRYLTANGLKVRRRRRTRAGRRVGGRRVSSGGPRLAGPYRCRRPDRPILVGIMLVLHDDYPMPPFHAFQRNGPTIGWTGPTDISDHCSLMYGRVSDSSVTRDDALLPRLNCFWATNCTGRALIVL